MFLKDDPLRSYNRNRELIGKRGAVFNINEGIDYPAGEGCTLRLIGWPGTGTRMVSFHLLIHKPGGATDMHNFLIGEECIVCLRGLGEVDLGAGWESVAPGNVIFVPQGVIHATRCAPGSPDSFVALSYVCPSPLELYHKLGLMKGGVLDIDALNLGMLEMVADTIPLEFPITEHRLDGGRYNAEALGYDTVHLKGGIFHLLRGAPFRKFGALIRFCVWPGVGANNCGLHVGQVECGKPFKPHIHPVSEDAFLIVNGETVAFLDDRWIPSQPGDIIYAPPYIYHGTGYPRGDDRKLIATGCACPPQLDLYELAGYIQEGSFTSFDLE